MDNNQQVVTLWDGMHKWMRRAARPSLPGKGEAMALIPRHELTTSDGVSVRLAKIGSAAQRLSGSAAQQGKALPQQRSACRSSSR